ncbi:RIB43A-like with coiled-coils protein 1 isoform X2 [Sparus aurata]|uniref:RIB43A-like with coiled-coils protein 1 isoform X2 n=1 Tax=Sparus aurata TaxID=8175 RepID=UPI0011C0DBD1|nr:RIB43A-like with coiled-coils protein 1 isoform X2 [Sparus aurata]
MYKLDLPVDQSEVKAAERRRSAETTRKARIFNTRHRVMGIDVDALNQQVQEKKHQQHMEMQRDKAFDKLRKYHNDALLQQDINEEEKRAALHTDLTQYWATNQRVEDSRDADLKCGLKGAISITIPEGELGPASMQIFQGEGTGEDQRRKEQMKMTERDLRAQKELNERKHMADKHREVLVSKELVLQDLRGVQLQAFEEDCKKAARISLDNYNRALATEQAETLKEQRRREERENLAELLHTLTSDMMTECAEAAKKERQREAEKAQDAARELQLLRLTREAEEEERRAAEFRREKNIQTDRYNVQLAREQQAYQEYLNKKLYTNKPTKSYFNQFNTSSR